ncbi:MAG: type I restriction-modification enzyme R subunit C-terminal domain-containing protein [Thermodesulfovibrionales bacterium]|jgi:type I restriction enzyme R subunit|nr:type I restriction-modification enzyme R subunit C-terminal domain-containing protein [Thermodesulfovibrionales bacterium]
MSPTPEDKAREQIDRMLEQAGWHVCDYKNANIRAGTGVVIRNFPLKPCHGTADYLFYIEGRAAGIIEAKKEGTTLTGVEIQSDKYKNGLPDILPAWYRPLPFCYESTGVETRFTNYLDPDACSRRVFSFHHPETLVAWLKDERHVDLDRAAEEQAVYGAPSTLLLRLRNMPPLKEEGLWPAQIKAIKNLEKSLAENRPRALIQMATGSGKTFTAVTAIYRMIKFAGAKRILFLVDRANLGRQTLKEFKQYDSPYSPYKFTEEFLVQHMKSNQLDKTARVCISTIQRLYSMLKGEEIDPELEEESLFDHADLYKEPVPVEYNPAIPIETFDVIITDECHRSIYNLWRQVLEYFDAFIIGLTATPNKQTFGFFNQNLVMEYPHEQAVADGVDVNYDVYRIRTEITQKGSMVEAGYYIDKRDRETRVLRWERLDEDLKYAPEQLDRDVVAVDQIRTVIQTFRDKLFTEIFPGRKDVPKTLIYAKDDSHAEDIVKIVREEFGKGNEFCQKITYKTTGKKPEDLIAEFRNSYFPRIAVTVDMIATGTDIKPLEIVFFLRTVKSRSYFDQMKGRGVRVINPNDLQSVTPDAFAKTHFVIIDAVGVCEEDKTDSRPMERKPSVSLEKLLQAVALGNTETDVISSIAGRLARLDKKLNAEERAEIKKLAAGKNLKELTGELVLAIDPDKHIELAKKDNPEIKEPSADQIKKAAEKIIKESVKPFHIPELRRRLVDLYKTTEQTIDAISKDAVIEAGFSADAMEKAKGLVTSFEQFIKEHKDEITALQILYSRPYKERLRFEEVKALSELIERPPYLWRIDRLWDAYAALEKSRVRGAGSHRILTDLVSLIRFALHQEDELEPYSEHVETRFNKWLAEQEKAGKKFSEEQMFWLNKIKEHIIGSLSIDKKDFEYTPFKENGGLGKAYQLFGEGLWKMMDELNEVLAA